MCGDVITFSSSSSVRKPPPFLNIEPIDSCGASFWGGARCIGGWATQRGLRKRALLYFFPDAADLSIFGPPFAQGREGGEAGKTFRDKETWRFLDRVFFFQFQVPGGDY